MRLMDEIIHAVEDGEHQYCYGRLPGGMWCAWVALETEDGGTPIQLRICEDEAAWTENLPADCTVDAAHRLVRERAQELLVAYNRSREISGNEE